MIVVVPMCELLFSTSVYVLYLPSLSHPYPCLLFGYYCSDLRVFYQETFKVSPLLLMPCVPSGIALIGSILEIAGVELHYPITSA